MLIFAEIKYNVELLNIVANDIRSERENAYNPIDEAQPYEVQKVFILIITNLQNSA